MTPPNATADMAALRSVHDRYLCVDTLQGRLIQLPQSRLSSQRPLLCLHQNGALTLVHSHSEAVPPQPFQPQSIGLTGLDVVVLDGNRVALSAATGFVSARLDGSISLTILERRRWEEFEPRPVSQVLVSQPERPQRPVHRYAVFTSAGDRHNVARWIANGAVRDFALIVAYYGKSPTALTSLASGVDVFVRMEGAKFPNLKRLHSMQPGLLAQYDYVLVADDDLMWSAADISRAFRIAAAFDLWVCQAAFDRSGKISHPITEYDDGGQILRFTNYVEVTCPLFRTDKLIDFLGIYDGSLVGWGVDNWFVHHFGHGQNMKMAVLDCVVTRNPLDSDKPTGTREIDATSSMEQRHKAWLEKQEAYHIRTRAHRTLGRVFLDDAIVADRLLDGEG